MCIWLLHFSSTIDLSPQLINLPIPFTFDTTYEKFCESRKIQIDEKLDFLLFHVIAAQWRQKTRKIFFASPGKSNYSSIVGHIFIFQNNFFRPGSPLITIQETICEVGIKYMYMVVLGFLNIKILKYHFATIKFLWYNFFSDFENGVSRGGRLKYHKFRAFSSFEKFQIFYYLHLADVLAYSNLHFHKNWSLLRTRGFIGYYSLRRHCEL